MKNITLSIILFLCVINTMISQEMPNFFGQPPLEYKGCEYVEITLKTDSKTMERLLPDPLVADSSNNVKIYLIKQKYNGMEYNEVIIYVSANFKGDKKDYMKIIYLEESGPIVVGREIWGMPKVDAKMNYTRSENNIDFSLKRKGEELLSLKATLGKKDPNIYNVDEVSGFVIKEIPSATGKSIPDVKRLNTYTIRDLKIQDSQMVSILDFSYKPSEFNYMPDLGNYEIIKAVSYRLDSVLDYGDELHNYLEE